MTTGRAIAASSVLATSTANLALLENLIGQGPDTDADANLHLQISLQLLAQANARRHLQEQHESLRVISIDDLSVGNLYVRIDNLKNFSGIRVFFVRHCEPAFPAIPGLSFKPSRRLGQCWTHARRRSDMALAGNSTVSLGALKDNKMVTPVYG